MAATHGGARPKVRATDARGGARKGAGRPRYIRSGIVISQDAAQSIKILITARGQDYTPETVAAWVEEQAAREWSAYDQEIQSLTDEAYEGGIL